MTSLSDMDRFKLATKALNATSRTQIKDFEKFRRRVKTLLLSMTYGDVCKLINKHVCSDTLAFIESHFDNVETFVSDCTKSMYL